MDNRYRLVVTVMCVLTLVAGCGKAAPTATPTSTSLPPTATSVPLTGTSVSEASPAATATLLPPLSGSGGGLIAFVSTRDGNGEIYVVEADGSNPRRLTDHRVWDGFPTWSPDGRQIAFYTYITDKEWAIQVMDVDGGNLRQLTDNGVCDGAPYWSPDGTRIAYGSDAECNAEHREIYVIDTDGSNPRNLTQNDADDVCSSWSPDGEQIVFYSNRDGDSEIYVMNVKDALQGTDGSQVSQLTGNDAKDVMPAWSPDGVHIAFVSDRDGNDEIYVMDVNGTNVQRLTDNPTADWFPFWSPDGAQLLFNSKRDGGDLDVYVMDADGMNVRRLTDSPGEDFNAVWQPFPTAESASGSRIDTWIRTFEGDHRVAAMDALPTGDGGYLLVGATNYSHQDTAREDVHLMKTDSAGEMVWEKTYGGDRYDRGNAIVPTAGGQFIILGETESFGAGDRDVYLIKTDREGNELWSQTFGGPGRERANAIQQTTDGGYILIGATASLGAGGDDVYLVKTDSLGNEVWFQTYGSEFHEEGYSVLQTPDGGYLVLSEVLHGEGVYPAQNPDTLLLKTDGAGNQVWTQIWEGEGVQGGRVLWPASDGNYVIAGILSPTGTDAGMDFMFLKVDAGGDVIWDKPIGSDGVFEYGTDAIELLDGGYLLTGMFSRSGRGAIPLIKTNEDGEIAWRRNLVEGRGNKIGMKLFQAADGGYVVVGQTDEGGRGFETILIKTDSEGSVNE